MEIRLATEADFPRIAEIYNQAVDDGYCTADTEHISVESRQDWFVAHLEEKYPIHVLIVQNSIAGWSSLSPFRPGRKALAKVVEISYYLDRNSRGSGLGTRLMEATIDAARALGHQHLFAILLEINAVSIKLLEKFDFEKWGLMPDVADFGSKRSGLLIYGRRV
jgi:phosphinothricin acetyltransferase